MKINVLTCVVLLIIIKGSFQINPDRVQKALEDAILHLNKFDEIASSWRNMESTMKEHRCDKNLRVAQGGRWRRRDLIRAGQLIALITKKLGAENIEVLGMNNSYHVNTCNHTDVYRTADGSCNNLANPNWGKADTPKLRFVKADYDDGISVPRYRNGLRILPSARMVSTTVHEPDDETTFSSKYTHMTMQWGQFLDHDITLTPTIEDEVGPVVCCIGDLNEPHRSQKTQSDLNQRPECLPISIPFKDRHFDKPCMNFVRSVQVPNLQGTTGPVEQPNVISAYIDASQVYGSSEELQRELRTFFKGTLKSSGKNLLPKTNDDDMCNRLNDGEYCFKAGDIRVNDQPGLASIQTIFQREHNRIAEVLATLNTHWDDEKLFQETRKIVGALAQHITYNEFLPIILGDKVMEKFKLKPAHHGYATVYNKKIDASIRNEFSTAAYRFGHSLIRESFSRKYRGVNVNTDLSEMFFRPYYVSEDRGKGLNRIMNGLRSDAVQSVDRHFTTEITDRLFEEAPGKSFDLISLNIQRGRDHGIPSYNTMRSFCGLTKAGVFNTRRGGFVHHQPTDMKRMRNVYSHPEDVDLYTGGVSEQPVEGGFVGPTFACIIGKQFEALKFGDRFYYENELSRTKFSLNQLNAIKKVKLSRIICENSALKKIQGDVLKMVDPVQNPQVKCRQLPILDLSAWIEGSPDPPQSSAWWAWWGSQRETRK